MTKLVDKSDKKYIEEIIELEEKIFGKNGAIDIWNLKPYIKHGKVFVYLLEEKVVGVAEFMRSWEGNKAYLYGFCLKEECRGSGIGKQFINDIFQYIQKEKIDSIELTVAPDNIVAIKFYEKNGFEKVEFLENEYGDGKNRYIYIKNKI